VTAVCSGKTRKGSACTMPAAKDSDYCYLHDPDPAVAQRRSRNASRAATLGNSRPGAEIRSTRLMVRELLERALSNELHPLVRKRLTEIVQLLQVYCRLVELELTAGEKPAPCGVSLPEGTKERITEWAEGEEAKAREKEALVDNLSQAMKVRGYDPTPIRGVMGS
jgi:hypothetical protein